MIEPDGLAAFVAIAETGSFSRAADRLGIAQSVVSKRLKRLEDQLGTTLVDRSARHAVRLTRVGAVYLDEAREALAGLDRAARIGQAMGRGSAGPLRIGAIFSAALDGSLDRALTALHVALPAMQIDLHMLETPEQLAALSDGRLDLGFVRPRPSWPASCRARPVHREPLRLALAATHPLARRERLAAADCARDRFIIPQFREQVGLLEPLERLALRGGFALGEVTRTGDYVSAACLAAAGHGIALAPAALGRLALPGLVMRSLADFDATLETVMVSRRDAPAACLATLDQAMTEPAASRQ